MPTNAVGQRIRRLQVGGTSREAARDELRIRDVARDAFASMRRTVRTHLAFNALCIVAFVLWLVLLAFLFGRFANLHEPSASGLTGAAFVLVFVLLLIVPLPMTALHRGFTVAVSIGDVRGAPLNLSQGMVRAVRRLPVHMVLVLTRLIFDLPAACLLVGTFAAVSRAVVSAPSSGADDSDTRIAMLTISVLSCALLLGWMLVVRIFQGPAHAVAEAEERFDTHRTLLEGRRLALLRLRAVWGVIVIAIVGLLYLPVILERIVKNGASTPDEVPVVLFYLPVAYYGVFLVYAFDSVLESAFYMRAAHSEPGAGEVAAVFD